MREHLVVRNKTLKRDALFNGKGLGESLKTRTQIAGAAEDESSIRERGKELWDRVNKGLRRLLRNKTAREKHKRPVWMGRDRFGIRKGKAVRDDRDPVLRDAIFGG